jgi:xanthine/uracil permease
MFVCCVQVFCLIIIIEIFGSPFMRSASIVFALLIGTAVAAIATVDGKRFFNGKNIASAPAFTFLWVKRFPLGEVHGYYPASIVSRATTLKLHRVTRGNEAACWAHCIGSIVIC